MIGRVGVCAVGRTIFPYAVDGVRDVPPCMGVIAGGVTLASDEGMQVERTLCERHLHAIAHTPGVMLVGMRREDDAP